MRACGCAICGCVPAVAKIRVIAHGKPKKVRICSRHLSLLIDRIETRHTAASERRLDEALTESFPASDPLAIASA